MQPTNGGGPASAPTDEEPQIFATGEPRDSFSFDFLKTQAPYRPQKAPLAHRGDDLYETPPVAVHALLRAEQLPQRIWECACGPGSIARVLRARGHEVYASDLVDYESPDQNAHGVDFLLEHRAPDGVETVITNPPYKLAAQFVEHALELCPLVIMLLPLTFIAGQRRAAILEAGSWARVHVFKNRLPRMHRAEWKGPRATSTVEFAWFVWDRSHRGPTELHRISWGGAP
jgi:predicted RNA methylase